MKPPFALWVLCALAVLLTACDPLVRIGDSTESFTFVNETDEALAFYLATSGGAGISAPKILLPHSSFHEASIFLDLYSWIRVTAKRQDGQWVFDRTYSRDEWHLAGRQVVVSSLTPIALASDPEKAFAFVNETDGTLWFYVQGSLRGPLQGTEVVGPRSSIERSALLGGSYPSIRVAATRDDGQWVFDRTYSEDEWFLAGRRVVVSFLTPIASPIGVDVIPRDDAPRPVLRIGGLPPPRPTPGR